MKRQMPRHAVVVLLSETMHRKEVTARVSFTGQQTAAVNETWMGKTMKGREHTMIPVTPPYLRVQSHATTATKIHGSESALRTNRPKHLVSYVLGGRDASDSALVRVLWVQ
jgi:hypothetical protein